MHFVLRNYPDRVPAATRSLIESTIPNRLTVLDAMAIKAIVESDRYASFDTAAQLLKLPAAKVGDIYYELSLRLADPATYRFTLASVMATVATSYPLLTQFSNGLLEIPLVLVAGKRYKISLKLTGDDPIEFQLSDARVLN